MTFTQCAFGLCKKMIFVRFQTCENVRNPLTWLLINFAKHFNNSKIIDSECLILSFQKAGPRKFLAHPISLITWTNGQIKGTSLVQKCFDKILISVNGIDHQDLPKNHKRRKKCNVLIFWLNIVILDDQHLGVATISLFLKKRL